VGPAALRVLLVEDDEEDYLLTKRLLKAISRSAIEVTWARSAAAALDELRLPYDVCLVDYRLGAETGLVLIEKAVADGFRGPMILLTGRGDHDVDVEAMKAGAADYLVKDEITPRLLERVMRHSIERKAADAALRRSEEQLRQSQKLEAIGSLAGGVAHDFNNILSIILSYSELLVGDLASDDPMRADIAEIHAAGQRAAGLTRQLLAFSRQQVLQPKIVDLNEVFAGMESMLRRLLGEDIELTSIAAATLGRVLVDYAQMEQVIMNLAVNARDAMPKGGTLTVETEDVVLSESDVSEHTGLAAGPHVMLSVKDTGTGMDAATQSRMFEPFFTTKDIGKGTGLGLSTVFGIVKQSGGSIGVQSEQGKGTIFRTYFPLAGPGATTGVGLRPSRSPSRAEHRGSELVLVVEDDDRVRALACMILRRYGYRVLEASSSGDALIVCEQHPETIALVLADVVMPRMSGPELAVRLRAARPEIKVLFMSGYTRNDQIQHGMDDACTDFVQKPLLPASLARGVRDVLDGVKGAGHPRS
jgi:two-component system, cell cycle sensor histidine kinase and response regulator CckA